MSRTARDKTLSEIPPTIEQHYSVEQVSARLGISTSTLTRHMESRKLGYTMLGNRRLIPLSELKAYVARMTVRSSLVPPLDPIVIPISSRRSKRRS